MECSVPWYLSSPKEHHWILHRFHLGLPEITQFTLNPCIRNSTLTHTTRYCCSELVTAYYELYNIYIYSTVILWSVHIALITSQMKEGKFIIPQKPITWTHPHPVQHTVHLPAHSGAENSLQPTHFTHFNNLPQPLLGARLIECHSKVVKIFAVYSKESGFKSWSWYRHS